MVTPDDVAIYCGALVVTLPGRVLTCGLLSHELDRLAPLLTTAQARQAACLLSGVALDDLPTQALLRAGLTERQANGRMVRP